MQRCYKCKETKDLDCFHKNKNTPSGYSRCCKVCVQVYRTSHQERDTEIHRLAYRANPEKFRKLRREWVASHPEENRKMLANNHKKNWPKYFAQRRYKNYNFSQEQYDQMFLSQEKRCAACGTLDPALRGRDKWCLDHAHSCCPGPRSCGKCIRGILCDACNKALGCIQDKPEIALALKEYLLNSTNGFDCLHLPSEEHSAVPPQNLCDLIGIC